MDGKDRADWVTLRDYVDSRFDAICAELKKSDDVLEARLHALNDFRASMQDQSKNLMTREEYRLAHEPLAKAISEFRDFMATHQGKASQNQVLIAYALAVASMLIGIILHFVK